MYGRDRHELLRACLLPLTRNDSIHRAQNFFRYQLLLLSTVFEISRVLLLTRTYSTCVRLLRHNVLLLIRTGKRLP